jgi:hypothetical protein
LVTALVRALVRGIGYNGAVVAVEVPNEWGAHRVANAFEVPR